MKSGIFILLTILTIFWSSCSNEIPVGEGEGQEVTISASFQTGELKTKAEGDQSINNRFIAAFRDTVCTGIAYDNNDTKLKIKAKTGEVTFIAIANANEVEGLKSVIDAHSTAGTLPGYADLKDITTTVTSAAAFDPASFIKVTEEVRTGLVLADSAKTFNFRLFQLPAKISFNIKVAEGKGSFEVETFQVKGVNKMSKLVLSDTTTVTNEIEGYSSDFEELADAKTKAAPQVSLPFSFYTYERATTDLGDDALVVRVTGKLKTTSANPHKTYDMYINPVKGGENTTTGIVHGWHYDVTGTINPANTAITVTVVAKPWDKIPLGVDYGKDEVWKD